MILELLEGEYSVYKFSQNISLAEITHDEKFISITKTEDEISIVTTLDLKNYAKIEKDWKIIKINEMLDFGLIGIISKISNILANKKIGIFIISTYNTDYIMIKKEDIEKAIKILIENKYEFKNKI